MLKRRMWSPSSQEENEAKQKWSTGPASSLNTIPTAMIVGECKKMSQIGIEANEVQLNCQAGRKSGGFIPIVDYVNQ